MVTELKTGKVYTAQIIPPSDPYLSAFSDGQRVQNALSPGSRIDSYGREWIVGQTSVIEGVLVGRVGFEKSEGTAEVWDEDRVDFREVGVPQGLTAPFAVDLETLKLSIQPRGAIKANGMIRALVALLSLEGEKWSIEPLQKKVSLEAWKSSVDEITMVSFQVRKPNPHWQDAPDLEAVMEQARGEYAKLEVSSEDGLDLEAGFLKQTQEHVNRGYGTAEFRGVRTTPSGHKVETRYSSEVGAEEEAFTVPAAEDGEVSAGEMMKVVRMERTDGGSSAI